MYQEARRSPEEVRQEKVVAEFAHYIKASKDNIGLLGHQPSLKRIRVAYHDGELDNENLNMVLTVLYNKHKGESEPFEDSKHFFRYAFPHLVNKEYKPKAKPVMSKEEQSAYLREAFGTAPKKTKKRTVKKKEKIDVNALPERFKHLANGGK